LFKQKEEPVNKTLKTAAFAIALAGSTALGAASGFAADTVITFDPGTVRYGYADGYWTRDRQWRTWEKPEYVEVYRKHPGAQYHEWKHDRDPNMGWIEVK
jgi:hypothetical protein